MMEISQKIVAFSKYMNFNRNTSLIFGHLDDNPDQVRKWRKSRDRKVTRNPAAVDNFARFYSNFTPCVSRPKRGTFIKILEVLFFLILQSLIILTIHVLAIKNYRLYFLSLELEFDIDQIKTE